MESPHPYINCGVYVLKLEDGCFYVGCSENIERRLKEHEGGDASWTEKHSPIEVHDIFPAQVGLKQLEREVTLKYMREYGWEKVRGAGWSMAEMNSPPKELATAN